MPSTGNNDVPFVLFGTEHLLTIATILLAGVLLPLAIRRVGPGTVERRVAVTLAVALVAQELIKIWVRINIYGQPGIELLPLHLCGVSVFLVAYVLIWRSYAVFEVAYFWGLIGTVQAILTPDIPFGFPSLVFLTFFLGHGLVIVGVVYGIAVFGFRPTLRSVWKTIWVTLVYMAAVAPINFLLGTNYLYLRHKPKQASLLDYFGPWPWYILTLIAVGTLLIFIYYAPFAVLARRGATPSPSAHDSQSQA
ncbi:MAG: TIGR02206 family membrane protein [Chromatiales bacterium]|nr:MAG: TIGR02206 family membrane protein [Chromatiales bacterium]